MKVLIIFGWVKLSNFFKVCIKSNQSIMFKKPASSTALLSKSFGLDTSLCFFNTWHLRFVMCLFIEFLNANFLLQCGQVYWFIKLWLCKWRSIFSLVFDLWEQCEQPKGRSLCCRMQWRLSSDWVLMKKTPCLNCDFKSSLDFV